MPTTLLIVKNQGQPSNWSHYRNGSANALHFSAFRISIEAGEFQIEKINAGKLEKVLWSNVTVRDDSGGTMGTPVTPTSPIDLANILEGLGYPAYSQKYGNPIRFEVGTNLVYIDETTVQVVMDYGLPTQKDITISGDRIGYTSSDDGGNTQHVYEPPTLNNVLVNPNRSGKYMVFESLTEAEILASTPTAGDANYNTDTNKPCFFNGTVWKYYDNTDV